MNQETTYWGIHAGRLGEAESIFLKENVIAIGWKKMGDLSPFKNRDDFKERYQEVYPEARGGTIPGHAGVMYRFVHEIKRGDIVIFPRKLEREVVIGEVVGEYQYEEDSPYPHRRKVKWMKHHLRTSFSQGALYEIGSAITLFQVKNFAEEFAAALEGKEPEREVLEEQEEIVGPAADDIEQLSRDFVLKQINKRLKGHELTEFVAHLLNIMGYRTEVSVPGPDRGIDIVAHKDDLGVEKPVIKVQVKSSYSQVNEASVSELYGKVSEREFALFVALGDFNKRARDFAFGKHNLKLLNGNDLVDMVYRYYDSLDSKYKGIIPLRRVYIPETLLDDFEQ